MRLLCCLNEVKMRFYGIMKSRIIYNALGSKFSLGIDGIDPIFGLSTSSMPEAKLNAQMIHAAQKTIVLSDSSKFGMRSLSRICDVRDIHCVITDQQLSEHFLKQMHEAGIEIVLA